MPDAAFDVTENRPSQPPLGNHLLHFGADGLGAGNIDENRGGNRSRLRERIDPLGRVFHYVGRGEGVRTAEHPAPSAQNRQVAGTQTITRALSVLRVLRDAEGDVGVTEMAHALDLHSSTTHRIVRALVVAGYVVQNKETERYRLGLEAFLLGRAAGQTLGFDAAMPLLDGLAEETGESVNLVVRDGDHALVILRVESKQPLRFSQPTGTRIPLYCTSTGKALLAFAGDLNAEVARLGELERLTPATITSPRDLLRDLEEIRSRGFSINRGERVPGVCGVAAPVLGSGGVATAALAVQGPEIRMPDDRIAELGPLVMEVARAVVASLPAGYEI
ncbi:MULTISPECIES: IclR family transcriptional regulator [unclassified Rhodococcus (in: high G+C Gram-positive bacteria)]|uniref:IclR family transcriptional regulator n=1 Tax=unclassified Rhodococcus (in: high G+C Gram-positive bacteria) TaxID=192944 RepID=UPI001ED9353E|nr:IclR family transcriptional regulator [Rhodococcus sp. DK17]